MILALSLALSLAFSLAPVPPASAYASDVGFYEASQAAALGDKKIYFGNLHAHTGYSDGTGTPAQGYQWARSHGLDFYAVTDHSEQLSAEEWDDTLAQSDAYSTAGRFAALAGFEWSGGVGHVNVLNTRTFTSSRETRNLESLYNWIAANGGIGQFNHPNARASFGDMRMSGNPNARSMCAIETGNAGAGNNTRFFYDYFIKALDRGWKVAPTNNQDNHYIGSNCHRTAVVASSLYRADVVEALTNRRIYSTDDPNLELTLKCGDAWMGSNLEAEHGKYRLSVTVRDDEEIGSLRIISNGGEVVAIKDFNNNTHHKRFSWNPEITFKTARAYYFLEVVGRDLKEDDEHGRNTQIALSAPIWFTKKKHDVSIAVSSESPIIAERPMYFDYQGKWPGGTTETGTRAPGETWYLAEGSTWPGFEEWICIQNPGKSDAWVEIVYMFPSGNRRQATVVSAHSRKTISVNDAVGPGKDVSAMVTSSKPIVVERPMYFDYGGRTGGSLSAAVAAPSKSWYLAEGTTQEGYEQWISLMNPADRTCNVLVTYMREDGKTLKQGVLVKAKSRKTLKVNDFVGPGRDVSARIQSDLPIVVERAMYFDYKRAWSGGSSQSGATSPSTSWFFAEGTTRWNRVDGFYDEYICVMNPGDRPANLRMTYMFPSGDTLDRQVVVSAHSRKTVFVNDVVGRDKDVSLSVTSDRPVVAERPMYYFYHSAFAGGHVELGCTGGSTTWYFAEGTNRDGFEEWLTLQNPGESPTEATVTMMLEDATVLKWTYSLPARSRTTLTVNGLLAL